MAGITNIRAVNVSRIFARDNGTVMANGTNTVDLRVVNCRCQHRTPQTRRGGMTGVAKITCVDVSGNLAACRNTIVTRGAGAGHARMIDPQDGCPRGRPVAIVASVSRRNVGGVLARGRRPVVAG